MATTTGYRPQPATNQILQGAEDSDAEVLMGLVLVERFMLLRFEEIGLVVRGSYLLRFATVSAVFSFPVNASE